VDVRVNVGFGNLSPDQRLKKIVSGLEVMAKVAPWTMANLDAEEVAQEIFGALGHKNGKRFFTDLSAPKQEQPPEVQAMMMELEIKKAELQNDAQYKQAQLQQERELKMMELSLKENIPMQQLQAKLGVDKERMNHERELAGAKNLTSLASVEQKERELQFKRTTGRQGI
jgi:hypothetical protein